MRIVSLSPSITEIIYAIGASDLLVGVTAFCDYPKQAREKPKVGGWSTVTDEKILALKPDIVLTSTIVQEKSIERYKEASFVVHHFDPRSLADIYENILAIGKLVNREKEAERLIFDMKKEVNEASRHSTPRSKRVYCEEWPKPPMISGNWVPELVELAGGQYGIIKKGEISRKVTDEEVFNFDPEVIILNYCGFGTRSDPKKIKRRPGWDRLSAVRANQIYVIDDSLLNRPGLRIIEGLRRLRTIFQKKIVWNS